MQWSTDFSLPVGHFKYETTGDVLKTKMKHAEADLNIGKSGQMGNSGNVDCQSSYTPSAFLPIKQITSLPHSPSSHLYFLGWNLDRQLFFAPLDISKPVDLIFGSPFPVNGIFFVDINIGEIVDQVRPQFPVELLSRLCKYQIYS